MKRFVISVAALVGAAVVTSGCNPNGLTASSSVDAARVGSAAITTGQLNTALSEIAKDRGFVCLSQSGSVPKLTGTGTDTYSMSYVDKVLTDMIEFDVTSSLASSLHASGGVWAASLAKQQVIDRWSGALSSIQQQTQANCGTAAAILASLGHVYASATLDDELQQDAIAAHIEGVSLDPGGVAEYATKNPMSAVDSCVSVIQVTTKATAVSIATAIAKGASFASEASSKSDAQGAAKNGAVGCLPDNDWVAPLPQVLFGLKVGAVSAPVSYSGSWLLLTVTSKTPSTAIEIVDELTSATSAQLSQLSTKALESTKVYVNPQYGSWEIATSGQQLVPEIVAPGQKAAAAAPNNAAVTPPATFASFTP